MAGSYSRATNLTDASECTDGSPGHFATTGSNEQTACREGSFTDGTRNGACELCAEGYYQDQPAAAACVRCAAGKFCPQGSSRKLDAQCAAGIYARLTDRNGDPECLACPAGSSCGGGAAPPSECSPGSFALSVVVVLSAYFPVETSDEVDASVDAPGVEMVYQDNIVPDDKAYMIAVGALAGFLALFHYWCSVFKPALLETVFFNVSDETIPSSGSEAD